MATYTWNTAQQVTTDAEFRAWCVNVHAGMVATGWLQTTDTGQINLATVTKAVGASTAQGYEIWRMADTLQATVPFFMKLEYGSGTSANGFGIWVTLGPSTDGAGTITGSNKTSRVVCGQTVASATLTDWYMSGDTARWCLGSNATAANLTIIAGAERIRDTAGVYSSAGAIVIGYTSGTALGQWETVPGTNTAGNGIRSQGWPALVDGVGQTTMVDGGNTGFSLVHPTLRYVRPPMLGVVCLMGADFAANLTFTGTVYGASHTFKALGTAIAGFNAYGAAARPGMLYE